MNQHELARFLDEHPDWYPAVYASSDNCEDTVRVMVIGAYGPSGHFFNFCELSRVIGLPASNNGGKGRQ